MPANRRTNDFKVIERGCYKLRTILELLKPSNDDEIRCKEFDAIKSGSTFWWASASSNMKITGMVPDKIKPLKDGSKMVFVIVCEKD